MRDILEELFTNQPIDPTESVRRQARPNLRKRFYERASAGETTGEGGFALLLDGKPIRTPLRRPLAAPSRALAEAIADEWNAQAEVIDPARMPLTRLANAVIDAVADKSEPVADEVAKYLGSDLLLYRAEGPEGLIAREGEMWDPVLAWMRDRFGARFVQVQGVMHAAQPKEAIAAARAAIPANIWRLGAVSSITTLTGSALLALALAHGAIDAARVWAAAHVDEDWQIAQWGEDTLARERRAYHHTELQAAATVLALVES